MFVVVCGEALVMFVPFGFFFGLLGGGVGVMLLKLLSIL